MTKVLMKPQKSTVHMVLSPISKLTTVWSTEVFIHGIPWQVNVYKNEDKNSLSIYLNCAKEDNSSTWTVPACATIKLLPFSDDKDAHKRHIDSNVFNTSCLSFGYPSFIQWDELLKAENKYVQGDTIELKIKITAEDPNYVNRSILKFESIDRSCDCGSHVIFRLTVTNVENLLAVRSPQFIVRGLPWDLSVYKHQSSNLGIMLDAKKSSKKVSCKMEMSVKLMSSKDDVMPIERSSKKPLQMLENLKITNILPWNELLKPEKGYVNTDSITLKVELKADKPEGNVPNVEPSNVAKRGRFECSICLEGLENQDISATKCGHMFCTACITAAVKKCSVCPLCKAVVELNDLRRLYSSAAK